MSSNTRLELIISEMRKNGREIPNEIWDIPEFPFQLFDELIDSVQESKVKVLRHSRSMNSSIFDVLSNKEEKILGGVGQLFFWCGVPLALVLGYFFSWWFMLLPILTFVWASKLISSSYNSAIFRSALSNEGCFCFLYYLGQISIGFTDNHDLYFYEGE